MAVSLRIATGEDLPDLWCQVRSAVAFMNSLGNPQWNSAYPTLNHFSAAVEAGSLFVALVEDQIAGAVILDENQAPEYRPLPWSTPEKSLVIHKLALGQPYMGRGVAGAMLAFAREEACRRGLGGLRVDTYHKNLPMRRLLAKQGFSFVGPIQFPFQQPGDYLCFEKRIDSDVCWKEEP